MESTDIAGHKLAGVLGHSCH